MSDGVLKETAPICQAFKHAVLTEDSAVPSPDMFTAWLGSPGTRAPSGWLEKRDTKTLQINHESGIAICLLQRRPENHCGLHVHLINQFHRLSRPLCRFHRFLSRVPAG
jgi:hypothetical protein